MTSSLQKVITILLALLCMVSVYTNATHIISAGIMDEACFGEPVLMTDSSGIIQDHNRSLSDSYQNQASCSWQVEVENARSIRLTFLEFDLEQGFDTLTVSSATGMEQTQILSGSTLPPTICVNSSSLSVDFLSDHVLLTNTVFVAIYEASYSSYCSSECNVAAMSPACSAPLTLTSANGTIEDHNRNLMDNYLNNQSCSWHVDVENATSIIIEFTSVQLDWSDYIYVQHPSDYHDSLYLTGFYGVPPPLCFDENSFDVFFESDSDVSRSGFSLSYTSSTTEACATRMPVC